MRTTGRRWLCAVAVAVFMMQSLFAQQPLAGQIDTLLAEPNVARAHWGVMVTAMDGTPLYAHNEGQLFQPASNAKLFTTTAAVHLLGEQRRFTTALEGPPGSQGKTTLAGDLTLHGAGDANISGRGVPYVEPFDRVNGEKTDPLRYLEQMADQVVAAGVKHITGDIVGDDTLFPWQPYAPDWAADDLLWGYGAPVSALTINDNQIQLKIAPAERAGYPATVTLDPAVPYYTLRAEVQTVAAHGPSDVDVARDLGSRTLRVTGTIAARSSEDVEEVAIHDPAEYAAVALKAMLEERGIRVDGIARAQHRIVEEPQNFLHAAKEPLPGLPKEAVVVPASPSTVSCSGACPLLVQHASPTVMEDITITNKNSQNLHAELLLRQMGKAYGGDGSIVEGARVVRQFLVNAGLDPDDFYFYDGSGLSGHDLVTPRAVTKLLAYAATQPWFADWKASLPVGGVDGSLEHRFTEAPLKGRVFAKTGTLGEARALSGYVECASGRTVIFSIMVDNHAPGTHADREAMDRIVAAIAVAN